MKISRVLSLIATVSISSMFLGFGPRSEAATATNLVTICLSATTTTQASKCTKWQYNVYSATAYIETYPQVSPGPKVWTDPAYQYILGSTITPSMGVKVCPSALTPGTTFTSASADPCPNNVLISASTVLPPNTYAVTTNADGIVVYQINPSGVSQVPGSPFGTSPPSLTAVDPTGQYLYATYNTQVGTAIFSYRMVNGVPQQLSDNFGFSNGVCGCPAEPTQLIATAQHVYANAESVQPYILVSTTANGIFTNSFIIAFRGIKGLPPDSFPISFAVDPQEQYLYWYISSTGGTIADSVAIFSLDFAASSATFIQFVPQQGGLTLGAK